MYATLVTKDYNTDALTTFILRSLIICGHLMKEIKN